MGCHVEHMSYAAFGYADDLLLLSPSIHGLEIGAYWLKHLSLLLVNMA